MSRQIDKQIQQEVERAIAQQQAAHIQQELGKKEQPEERQELPREILEKIDPEYSGRVAMVDEAEDCLASALKLEGQEAIVKLNLACRGLLKAHNSLQSSYNKLLNDLIGVIRNSYLQDKTLKAIAQRVDLLLKVVADRLVDQKELERIFIEEILGEKPQEG